MRLDANKSNRLTSDELYLFKESKFSACEYTVPFPHIFENNKNHVSFHIFYNWSFVPLQTNLTRSLLVQISFAV